MTTSTNTAVDVAVTGDAAQRRAASRRFVTGVAVLTCMDAGTAHGCTVSAVSVLSRDPLMVGASMKATSRFARLVRRAGSFTVNVLGADQSALAGQFADPLRPSGEAQFAHTRWATDRVTRAPAIDGALAALSCRLSDIHPVADHALIVGEVVDGRWQPGEPLLNYAGQLFHSSMRGVPRNTTHPARVFAPERNQS